MNKQKVLIRIGMLMLAIPIVMLSCQKLDDRQTPPSKTDNIQLSEKMTQYESMGIVHLKSVNAVLNYNTTLYSGSDIYANVAPFTIWNPAAWMYYKFYGSAGQFIDIHLVRVSCEMDPAYSLFFGTSTTTDGIYPTWSDNPDLEWLLFLDDDLDPPAYCTGGCFAYWDPTYGYTLPYTGWYTLGVYDYIACAGTDFPLEYHLTIDGLTIVIEDCDTYVNNQMIDGFYMQELIEQCAIDAKNHGKYVSCVAQLTGGWVELGLITEADKDAIMMCAAESGIPYPE